MIQQLTSRYITKGIESRITRRYLHAHVNSSIVYNSQKGKTTQVFTCPLTDEWLNKIQYMHTVHVKCKLTKSQNSLGRQNHCETI